MSDDAVVLVCMCALSKPRRSYCLRVEYPEHRMNLLLGWLGTRAVKRPLVTRRTPLLEPTGAFQVPSVVHSVEESGWIRRLFDQWSDEENPQSLWYRMTPAWYSQGFRYRRDQYCEEKVLVEQL